VLTKTCTFFLDFIPTYVRARGEKAVAAYHRALASGRTYDKRVKILLVGQDRVCKTSLSKSLRGEPFNNAEPSTEGVQMIPPDRNAKSGAWKNPTSFEHTTVFDHKISSKVTEELFSTRSADVTEDQELKAHQKTIQKTGETKEHGTQSYHTFRFNSEIAKGTLFVSRSSPWFVVLS